VIVSPTLRSIWAEAYGERFWPDLDPPWTQATIDDVWFTTDRLRPSGTSRFVDLGCGSGCFLCVAARDYDQHIVGVDSNPMAIRLAKERGAGLLERISLRIGDIGDTGFPTATFDGAVSLDVLLLVPDKNSALREVARILKPGARFVGTTFELKTASAALSTPAFEAYPSAFEAAGFMVELCEEVRDWRKLLEGVLADILAREVELSREIHPTAWARVCAWARSRPLELPDSRRVRFSVRRPLAARNAIQDSLRRCRPPTVARNGTGLPNVHGARSGVSRYRPDVFHLRSQTCCFRI
jgi:ubiquinone/menaquinone biosynthesis C-methylase UbiE